MMLLGNILVIVGALLILFIIVYLTSCIHWILATFTVGVILMSLGYNMLKSLEDEDY